MLYVLLAMGFGLALATLFDDNEPDLVVDQNGDRINGTDGDDTVTTVEAPYFGDVEVQTGAGDDLIDLLDAENQRAFWAREEGSTIEFSDDPRISGLFDGGAGDDTINVRVGSGSEVRGGDGNDRLFVEGAWVEIYGDAGDDYIELNGNNGWEADAFGGTGNDTIDGTYNENGTLSGGEGDDLLIGGTGGHEGDGYASRIVGGEGEDTLRFELVTDANWWDSYQLQIAEGGAGADRFEVIFDEGDPLSQGDYYGGDEISDPLVMDKGLELEDFTPGEDTLVLDIAASDPRFTLASVEMAEVEQRNGGEIMTEVTVTYETNAAELREHQVIFRLGATGVTWDDVEIVGADRSILVPLVA